MEINEPQENYQAGWIKIFRSIQEHWIWQDAEKLKWWLDLMLEANHSEKDVVLGYDVFQCKRGDTIRSLSGWAVRWNVSKDTARNFLDLLEKHGMIVRVNLGKTTRITVCNYDTYQSYLHVKQTPSKRVPYAKQTRPIHKQEQKELKNEEEIDIVLGFLNLVCKTDFKLKSKAHREFINARIKEGFVPEDFKLVIKHKFNEWANDSKMKKYLRPSTLFNSEKFDGYLQEAKAQKPQMAVKTEGSGWND